MAFFDLTPNDDNVTLSSGLSSPSGGTPYAPGDSVRAFEGNDIVNGSEANDDINGNANNDNVFGAGGDDNLRGGQGNDVVQGSEGSDTVNGNIGNDTVDGGNGDDVVFGGQNDDVLTGGSGDDDIVGDIGFDILTGGFGADLFVLQANKGTDTITDFSSEDSFDLISGGLSAANLDIQPSATNTLIVDKISGQTIAVVQGVDVNTVTSKLAGSSATRRLKVVAQSGSAAGFNAPSLAPVTSPWTSVQTPGSGWSADGLFTTSNESLIFSYQPDGSGLERIALNIDANDSGGLRFAASNYGYSLQNTSFIPTVVVPLITTGNLFSANIIFADTNNASELQGTLRIV
jgi:RTX calcium-binding nonapeptide repeat (4 copies)